MNLHLFSTDERLAGFCRDVLAEMFGPDSQLNIGTSGQLTPAGDICLWDFTPGEMTIPSDLDISRLHRHLFLVHRQDLQALQETLGTSDFNVLLKPVMPATLRAFLGDIQVQGKNGGAAHAGNLQSFRLERDEMLQFLIQANLRLQEYDQDRTNFMARSIHDFRAPLTAISGYCSLLLEEELGTLTSDQKEVLERMQHSADRLSRITNAMFQLSIRQRIERDLQLDSADIRECIDQALHEVALFLEDKRIALTVDVLDAPAGLWFDKSQMEQALVNLLDNARKFTPRSGAIEIRGYPYFWERRTCNGAAPRSVGDRRKRQSTAPNSFRVDIRDSGPGIPAVQVGKIFEENSSYVGGHDRSGGGLGLAICRMILQQHGGRVWAESHDDGALFCFVLPLHPADKAAGTPAVTEFVKAPSPSPAGEEGWS